jgi:hypothetical protein
VGATPWWYAASATVEDIPSSAAYRKLTRDAFGRFTIDMETKQAAKPIKYAKTSRFILGVSK